MTIVETERSPRTLRFEGASGNTVVGDLWGPERGGVLTLLLHGGGQTRHSWRRAGAALAEGGGRALALDARGHGDSDWIPDGDYRASAQAADVLRVLEQLGEPVVLVGASMGGLTGLAVAAEAGPERASGLVLVDIVPGFDVSGGARVQGFMQSHRDGFASLEEAADAVSAYLPHQERPKSPNGLRRNLRQREDGRWYWHWDPAFLTPRVADEGEWRRHVEGLERAARDLSVPLAVIRGALSDVVGAAEVAAFLEIAPRTRVVELRDAGHTAAGSDNYAFTRAVVDLVRDMSG
ncbi:alpha/beta hydrolase [Actinocorallia sp. API 0066]|uniref:alpha/beta fold hydrolase n=1 Tax=Actinocorallia sp. API 0066 TaxID=2896846 RepID=UPI001E3D06E5|nr:alpha/beta fold hydrolase [Actinocorallia sp. API 0066]MCD0449862.1 alpha/beta hydrolase [Actinocorallia sp. API 0066]